MRKDVGWIDKVAKRGRVSDTLKAKRVRDA